MNGVLVMQRILGLTLSNFNHAWLVRDLVGMQQEQDSTTGLRKRIIEHLQPSH